MENKGEKTQREEADPEAKTMNSETTNEGN